MELHVFMSDDYRTGRKILVYDLSQLKKLFSKNYPDLSQDQAIESIQEYSYSDERVKIEQLPENLCHILLLQMDLEFQDIVLIQSTPDKMSSITVCNHISSEINDCLPFVTTHPTSGYRQEGYYPDPLPYKGLLNVDLVKKINDR
jgi:hypothetical protein